MCEYLERRCKDNSQSGLQLNGDLYFPFGSRRNLSGRIDEGYVAVSDVEIAGKVGLGVNEDALLPELVKAVAIVHSSELANKIGS